MKVISKNITATPLAITKDKTIQIAVDSIGLEGILNLYYKVTELEEVSLEDREKAIIKLKESLENEKISFCIDYQDAYIIEISERGLKQCFDRGETDQLFGWKDHIYILGNLSVELAEMLGDFDRWSYDEMQNIVDSNGGYEKILDALTIGYYKSELKDGIDDIGKMIGNAQCDTLWERFKYNGKEYGIMTY